MTLFAWLVCRRHRVLLLGFPCHACARERVVALEDYRRRELAEAAAKVRTRAKVQGEDRA